MHLVMGLFPSTWLTCINNSHTLINENQYKLLNALYGQKILLAVISVAISLLCQSQRKAGKKIILTIIIEIKFSTKN